MHKRMKSKNHIIVQIAIFPFLLLFGLAVVVFSWFIEVIESWNVDGQE